ncbi:MAG: efflux RND transporter periplasmic adaptor subunit [Tepidisphaeraceae bacterium]|jgi:RND family efflux transporter MFP subunit
MKLNWYKVVAAVLAGVCISAAGPNGTPTPPKAADALPGITRPSERQQLSLKGMDVIWEVKVKRGDVVKAGDLLLTEDLREEAINLQIITVEAESEAVVKGAEVAVEAAIVTLANKEVEFKRVEDMFNKKVATPSEYDKARLDVDIARLEISKARWDLEKAKYENAQKKLQVKRQTAVIERMKMLSPIDGIIEDVILKKGEVVDPQKPVIIVVKNDPLWVEVYMPTNVSLKLKAGQELPVKYDIEDKARMAKVNFLSPVADAGAGMQLVALELPNPEGKPAGLQVTVYPPGAAAPVAAGK